MSSNHVIDPLTGSTRSRSTNFLQRIIPTRQAVSNGRATAAFNQLGPNNMSQTLGPSASPEGSRSLAPLQSGDTSSQPTGSSAQGVATNTASEQGTPLGSPTASFIQEQDTPLASANHLTHLIGTQYGHLDDLLQKIENDVVDFEGLVGNHPSWTTVFKSKFQEINRDIEKLKEQAKKAKARETLTKVYRLSARLGLMFSKLQERTRDCTSIQPIPSHLGAIPKSNQATANPQVQQPVDPAHVPENAQDPSLGLGTTDSRPADTENQSRQNLVPDDPSTRPPVISATEPENSLPESRVETPRRSDPPPPYRSNGRSSPSSSSDGSVYDDDNRDHRYAVFPSARQILNDLENSPELAEFIQGIVTDTFNKEANSINQTLQGFGGRLSTLETLRVRNRDISLMKSTISDLRREIGNKTAQIFDLETALQNLQVLNDGLISDLSRVESANNVLTSKVADLSKEVSSLKDPVTPQGIQSANTQNHSSVVSQVGVHPGARRQGIQVHFTGNQQQSVLRQSYQQSILQPPTHQPSVQQPPVLEPPVHQPSDRPDSASSGPSVRTLSPPASRLVNTPSLPPAGIPFNSSSVERLENSIRNATEKLNQLVSNNPISNSSSRDAVQRMKNTICLQIADKRKMLLATIDKYERIPNNQQDMVLLNYADSAVSDSDDWTCTFQTVFDQLDCHSKPLDGNLLYSSLDAFSEKSHISIFEFLSKFEFVSGGKGTSAQRATLLYESYLSEPVKERCIDVKEDYDELLARLKEIFGTPSLMVRNIVRSIPTTPPSINSPISNLVVYMRSLDAAFMKLSGLFKSPGIDLSKLKRAMYDESLISAVMEKIPAHKRGDVYKELDISGCNLRELRGQSVFSVIKSWVRDETRRIEADARHSSIEPAVKTTKDKSKTANVATGNQTRPSRERKEKEQSGKGKNSTDSRKQDSDQAQNQNGSERSKPFKRCPLPGHQAKPHSIVRCKQFLEARPQDKLEFGHGKVCYQCLGDLKRCSSECSGNVPADIICQLCLEERPNARAPNIIMCPKLSHREGICEEDMLHNLAEYFPEMDFNLNERALLGIH